jgi:hypothetical protein
VTDSLTSNDPGPLALHDLADRERDVLQELGRDADARVAFQGLRRRLRLHPQALTRTLRSLERAGFVLHDEKGYFVAPARRDLVQSPLSPPSQPLRPVFAALLPPHVDFKHLADQLSRRWFQGLRWYGVTEHAGEYVLHWLMDPNGANVRLRITARAIGLELEASGSNAPMPYEAVAPIMQAVATFYARGKPTQTEIPTEIPTTAG